MRRLQVMLPRSLERLMWFGKVGNPWGRKNPPSDTSPPTGASGAVRMLPLMSIPLKFRCPVGDVANSTLADAPDSPAAKLHLQNLPTQTERQLKSPFTINHLNPRPGVSWPSINRRACTMASASAQQNNPTNQTKCPSLPTKYAR